MSEPPQATQQTVPSATNLGHEQATQQRMTDENEFLTDPRSVQSFSEQEIPEIVKQNLASSNTTFLTPAQDTMIRLTTGQGPLHNSKTATMKPESRPGQPLGAIFQGEDGKTYGIKKGDWKARAKRAHQN